MGRKSASNTVYNCLVCWKQFIGLNSLTEHLATYINYSTLPFPCSSCSSAFKTKEERNDHCRENDHLNTYKTNDDPSKEMLLEHLLFDAEQAKRVGVEGLISVKHDIFHSALKVLRSNGDKMLACTLCAEKMKDEQALRNHIKRHLNYRIYVCKCQLKFYTELDVAQHTLATGHQQEKGMKNDDYCEMIVSHLMMESMSINSVDFIAACKATAMQKLRLQVLQLPPKRTRNMHKERTLSNSVLTSDLEPRCKHSERSVSSPGTLSSTSQIDVIESRAPPVKNKTGSSVGKERHPIVSRNNVVASVSRSVSNISAPEYNNQQAVNDRDELMLPSSSLVKNGYQGHPLHPPDLRTPLSALIKCITCNKMVDSTFSLRQKHVSEMHMGREHSNEDYTDLLEVAMKRSFPGQTYSSTQCNICGGSKCSDWGARGEHVKKKHSDMLLTIECPVCMEKYVDITEINKHWKSVHTSEDSAKKKDFDHGRRLYNIRLNEIILFAYPDARIEGRRQDTIPAVQQSRTSFSEMLVHCTKTVEQRSTDIVRSRRKSDSSESGSEMEVIDARTRCRNDTLSSVSAQIDDEEERSHVNTATHSVECDDSSSDDDDSITEVTPAIHLTPTLSTRASKQKSVSSPGHKDATPTARRCTKRVLAYEPEVHLISSDDSSSEGDKDDDIMVLKECSRTAMSTTSSSATCSLDIHAMTHSKKSRLTIEGNMNNDGSQNKSRWDQRERSCTSGRRKSDARVRRYIYDIT